MRRRKSFFTGARAGTIDFKKILAEAKVAGIKHCFIEQDETPAAPLVSVETSLKSL